MNARFWTWHKDSWVKLTLRPGQSLETYSRHHTCEGWSAEGNCWSLDLHGIVTHEWITEGRDCDGYSSQAGERYCHRMALKEVITDSGVVVPAWVNAGSECRDEYAEAAGY